MIMMITSSLHWREIEGFMNGRLKCGLRDHPPRYQREVVRHPWIDRLQIKMRKIRSKPRCWRT
jgi:hypothetical protein